MKATHQNVRVTEVTVFPFVPRGIEIQKNGERGYLGYLPSQDTVDSNGKENPR